MARGLERIVGAELVDIENAVKKIFKPGDHYGLEVDYDFTDAEVETTNYFKIFVKNHSTCIVDDKPEPVSFTEPLDTDKGNIISNIQDALVKVLAKLKRNAKIRRVVTREKYCTFHVTIL